MNVKGCPTLTPQQEEDITITQWTIPSDLPEIIKNTFPSIKDVLETLNVE
jgi:hypothetical protein